MNPIKPLSFILAIALSLAGKVEAQNVLTNGLVAYYPFAGGNLADASGNGFNLTNYGATVFADRFGDSNAYFFNGTSAYIGSSISPLSQTDNWTVAAWLRPNSLSQATAFAVCVGYNSGSQGDGYGFGMSGGQGTGGGSGTPGSQLWAFFPGLVFISTGFTFSSTNQWYHIVMEHSSGTLMLYVNGSLVTNAQPAWSPGQMVVMPTAFEVGSGSGSAHFFNGAVNDVRVYNRAFSASDVQVLYNYEASACVSPMAATAMATVLNGFVISANLTDSGCGYTNPPSVQIVGGGGTGATAVAQVTNGYIVGITITDAGTGYTSVPSIFIAPPAGCIPHSATATLSVANGFVVSATITDEGCGYTNTPSIQIIGGGGTGATATAVVTNGAVVSITITSAGVGYTNTPGIYLTSPLGAVISIEEAVVPTFSNLSIGSKYQLQSSMDLINWTNQGVTFMATNSSMAATQYFTVSNWNQLYFRLQGAQ
jgi:hypothetical protein